MANLIKRILGEVSALGYREARGAPGWQGSCNFRCVGAPVVEKTKGRKLWVGTAVDVTEHEF